MGTRKKFDFNITNESDRLATEFTLKVVFEPKIKDAAGRRQWAKEFAGRETCELLEGMSRDDVANLGRACLEILSYGLDD